MSFNSQTLPHFFLSFSHNIVFLAQHSERELEREREREKWGSSPSWAAFSLLPSSSSPHGRCKLSLSLSLQIHYFFHITQNGSFYLFCFVFWFCEYEFFSDLGFLFNRIRNLGFLEHKLSCSSNYNYLEHIVLCNSCYSSFIELYVA